MAVKSKAEIEAQVREAANRMQEVREAARRARVKRPIVESEPQAPPGGGFSAPGSSLGEGQGRNSP